MKKCPLSCNGPLLAHWLEPRTGQLKEFRLSMMALLSVICAALGYLDLTFKIGDVLFRVVPLVSSAWHWSAVQVDTKIKPSLQEAAAYAALFTRQLADRVAAVVQGR